MPNNYKRTLNVRDYNSFRESLPNSGVFEMTDCTMEIWCPADSDTYEIEKMVKLLESMVHVTDVQIGSEIEDLTAEDYRVIITEVKPDIRKKYLR